LDTTKEDWVKNVPSKTLKDLYYVLGDWIADAEGTFEFSKPLYSKLEEEIKRRRKELI